MLAATGAAVLACSQAATTKKKRPVGDPSELPMDGEEDPFDPPTDPDNTNDAGSFGLTSRQNDGGAKTDAGRPKPPDPPPDAGTASDAGGGTGKTYCTGPMAAGDIKIVEIMIASRTGSGDDGEWVELESTKNCWLNLRGLKVESPRGTTGSDFVTFTTDFDLPPYGTFIVADSTDKAKNHNLPGVVFAFNSTDVFKNDGDTIKLSVGTTVIDTLTYPNFTNLEYGASVSFPIDCAWSDRSDWNRWSYSFYKWDGVHFGSPNTENDDVACY
jgi:hypothetical protein